MKSILIVDGDAFMSNCLVSFLGRSNLKADAVQTFEDGLEYAQKKEYSLFLIDLYLDGKHGIQLVQLLRAMHITAPILIWTAFDPEKFETQSLDAGADAFIVKHTRPETLLDVIEEFLCRDEWRRQQKPLWTDRLYLGPAVLYRDSHELEPNYHRSIQLTETESRLLQLLFDDRLRTFSAKEIIQQPWGPASLTSEEAVHATIRRMRKKMEPVKELRGLIEGLPGRGYRFSTKVLTLPPHRVRSLIYQPLNTTIC